MDRSAEPRRQRNDMRGDPISICIRVSDEWDEGMKLHGNVSSEDLGLRRDIRISNEPADVPLH
jgi:hypothetical protein